ncbi:hypothetical protein [Paraburkholderia antibiotica]|uniref:Uncharacterized protein n=1 Tax=Paraburkholderia antibiotica TaxID=2728839 RepID=A0A7Y0A125_9BURK|nr:hypothetical protein [Paraburkholderia antibiotica]NML34551.1 hypothetical protein [Paraburkholderia antibiotica]
MHPYQKRQAKSTRADRRATNRHHEKMLRKGGKTLQKATADVSRLHAEGHALMWYACRCGHRERTWNSRDDVVPYMVPCPSCGRTSLAHVDFERDEVSKRYEPHEGQRVFVDMARDQAEMIVERAFARLGLDRDHKNFASTVDELLGHTSGGSPLVAIAGDVAYYAPRVRMDGDAD